MDVVKEESVFENGTHEITSVNELIIDIKYEEYKVPVIGSEDRVSLILDNLKIGISFWINNWYQPLL
jgi:hypothetical protein